MSPTIVFGHQPCGFVPKEFLYSKILTARRLRNSLGGEVVFFYHDSDHDYRETITLLQDRTTGSEDRVNFEQENKIQKKYSPMYCKRIPAGWKERMERQLHRFVEEEYLEIFRSVESNMVADFCLEIYLKLGLLDGVRIVRSSSTEFREAAMDLDDNFFADVEYEKEIVRAKSEGGTLRLHRGGGLHIELDSRPIEKRQISPSAQNRLLWMQSVLHATHYVMGSGEEKYLDRSQAPETEFLLREETDRDLHAPILSRVTYPV